MSKITPIELCLEPDTELADADIVPFDTEEIRNCKIVTSISRAQFGKFNGQPACFFVFEADFVPYYDVRFKYAEIELRILKSTSQPVTSQPTVIAYQPKRWQGQRATKNIQHGQQINLDSGLATQATTGANAGLSAGMERNVEYSELKKAWLTSDFEQSLITWRLCENDSTHEGIPTPLQGVVIVAGENGFNIRMRYYAKLSKSANPLSWAPGYARMSKPLVLDRASIGHGIGPLADGVDNMEKETFRLETFVATNWDL